MNSIKTTQKVRLFNLLASGTEITIRQATQRLRIANPSAVVSKLRDDGFPIATVSYTNAKGQTVYKYRIAKK